MMPTPMSGRSRGRKLKGTPRRQEGCCSLRRVPRRARGCKRSLPRSVRSGLSLRPTRCKDHRAKISLDVSCRSQKPTDGLDRTKVHSGWVQRRISSSSRCGGFGRGERWQQGQSGRTGAETTRRVLLRIPMVLLTASFLSSCLAWICRSWLCSAPSGLTHSQSVPGVCGACTCTGSTLGRRFHLSSRARDDPTIQNDFGLSLIACVCFSL